MAHGGPAGADHDREVPEIDLLTRRRSKSGPLPGGPALRQQGGPAAPLGGHGWGWQRSSSRASGTRRSASLAAKFVSRGFAAKVAANPLNR